MMLRVVGAWKALSLSLSLPLSLRSSFTGNVTVLKPSEPWQFVLTVAVSPMVQCLMSKKAHMENDWRILELKKPCITFSYDSEIEVFLLLSTGPRWLMPRMYCSPYWLIVLPLDVPDLTDSLLLWGPSGQRWRCLWTFLFSNVPTFATGRLQ